MQIKGIELTKQYNDNKVKLALNKLSFELNHKGCVFITGKSGSGKSTLLNIIGGIDRPSYGDILISNLNLNYLSNSELNSYRRQYVGMVFQDYNLISNLTVEDNVLLGICLDEIDADIVNTTLNMVGLNNYNKRLAKNLSGGEKQRVAIARAIIKKPPIILCDEPTGALDNENSKVVFTLLKEISKETLVIIVSHDLEAAYLYGERIIKLKEGNVVEDISRGGEHDENKRLCFDNDELIVKKKTILTNNEIDSIVSYLQDGDITRKISLASSVNFSPTVISDKEQLGEQLKIVSKPFSTKKIFHLGITFLKQKMSKVISLCALLLVSLSLFGISINTFLYSPIEVTINQLLADNYNYITARKIGDDYVISDNDINYLEQEIGVSFTKAIDESFSIENYFLYPQDNSYGFDFYISTLPGLGLYTDAFFAQPNFSLLFGDYPDNDQEILLTQMHLHSFQDRGFKNANIELYPDSVNGGALVGQEIQVYNATYTISGFVNTSFDAAKFEDLKDIHNVNSDNREVYLLTNEYNDILSESIHAFAYTISPLKKASSLQYSYAISPLPNDRDIVSKLVRFGNLELHGKDYTFMIEGVNNGKITAISGFLVPFSIVCLVIGLLIIIYAIFLLRGFVINSIDRNSKTIGVLLSLGFSKRNVMTILYLEPLLISVTAGLIAVIPTFIVTAIINWLFATQFLITAGVLTYNVIVVFAILAFSLLVVVSSSHRIIKSTSNKECVELLKEDKI